MNGRTATCLTVAPGLMVMVGYADERLAAVMMCVQFLGDESSAYTRTPSRPEWPPAWRARRRPDPAPRQDLSLIIDTFLQFYTYLQFLCAGITLRLFFVLEDKLPAATATAQAAQQGHAKGVVPGSAHHHTYVCMRPSSSTQKRLGCCLARPVHVCSRVRRGWVGVPGSRRQVRTLRASYGKRCRTVCAEHEVECRRKVSSGAARSSSTSAAQGASHRLTSPHTPH